jgi:hypothetical protein
MAPGSVATIRRLLRAQWQHYSLVLSIQHTQPELTVLAVPLGRAWRHRRCRAGRAGR